MISSPEKKKVIWIKKAKCAGTSFEERMEQMGVIYYVNPKTTLEDLECPDNQVICIREALFPYGATLFKEPGGRYRLKGPPKLIYDLRRYLHIPFHPLGFMLDSFPDFMVRYPKFAVVRNPYDKFISSWKYLKSTRNRDLAEVIANLPAKRHLHDWIHIVQLQVDCIITKDSSDLLVDQLIYMEEDLDYFISNIVEYLGYSFEKLPKRNRSKRGAAAEYLNVEISESIFKLFKRDFEVLGYSRDYSESKPTNPVSGVNIRPGYIHKCI